MPDWNRLLRRRLSGLKLSPARETEIIDELAEHAEQRYRDLQLGGLTEDEALRVTLDELGTPELTRELLSVERQNPPEPLAAGAPGGASLIAGLGQDIRYTLRTVRKTPGFAAAAVFALALGIGANTAIFSVVNGVLLRPLRYPDSDRLLRIYETNAGEQRFSASYPNFLDWRRESRSFTDIGAIRSADFNFTNAGEPERLSGEYVSASLFPALGVAPFLGRGFRPEDDRPGAACAAIASYGFWKARFGADPAILGRTLVLSGASCAVVGVLPRNFEFFGTAEIYLPMEQCKDVELRMRESHGLRVVARLKPVVTLETAQNELQSIAGGLARQYPKTNAAYGVNLVPMKADIVGQIRPTLLLLVGATGFVLLIACSNVANLLLARSAARKREFAIRVALGAHRGRIVRQTLTESALLSLSGGAAGILLARWGAGLILAAAPESLPRAENIGIDAFVLLFTFALSVATGLIFGLVPALHGANTPPQESLKEGARGAGGGRHRAENTFVAVQVGLAVVLLVSAGLMIQSLWRLARVDPGFNTRQILTSDVALSPSILGNPQAVRLAYQQLIDRVEAVPGVHAAAITSVVPLSGNDSQIPCWPGAGPQPGPDRMSAALSYIVTPDYARVMQAPLRRGRFFNNRDTLASPHVVVVDELLANRFFPAEDAVGKQLSVVVLGAVEIVGVVGHMKHWGLDSDDTAKVRAQIYFPLMQIPDEFMSEAAAGLTLIVRTGPNPLSMVSAVAAQVAGPARDQPIYRVSSMEQIVSRSLARRRFTMLVFMVFSAAALVLAAVGIYGVMSFAVNRRTHEIGVRVALGASRAEIVALVLGCGMRLAALGLIGGLLAALALTRFMTALVYGVRTADPLTFAGVALLVGVVVLLACYIPARRATAVDPLVALRCE